MMPAQRPLNLYIGWLLIAIAAALFIAALLQIRWDDPRSILSLILAAILIGGIFVLPAVITLKQQWGDPAAKISGLICVIVFLALSPVSNRFSRDLSQLSDHSPVHTVLRFFIALAPLLIPFWLHKRLTQKIRSMIARRAVRR